MDPHDKPTEQRKQKEVAYRSSLNICLKWKSWKCFPVMTLGVAAVRYGDSSLQSSLHCMFKSPGGAAISDAPSTSAPGTSRST